MHCKKRSEPQQGALTARYKLAQLVEEFSNIETSLSVNSVGIMFDGALIIAFRNCLIQKNTKKYKVNIYHNIIS